MRRVLAAVGLVAAALLATAATATAQSQQDCGEAVVCADVDPRVDPQVGPVIEQVGPFEVDRIFG